MASKKSYTDEWSKVFLVDTILFKGLLVALPSIAYRIVLCFNLVSAPNLLISWPLWVLAAISIVVTIVVGLVAHRTDRAFWELFRGRNTTFEELGRREQNASERIGTTEADGCLG